MLRAVRRQEASVSILVLDDYETFLAEKGELRKSLLMFVGPDVDVGEFMVRKEITRELKEDKRAENFARVTQNCASFSTQR